MVSELKAMADKNCRLKRMSAEMSLKRMSAEMSMQNDLLKEARYEP